MTDYSAMTDFEINRLVAISLGLDCCNSHHPKNENGVIIVGNSTSIKNGVDYCNDWSAIGPIIEDYKISIEPLSYGGWFAGGEQSHQDKNPKRAAAICLLMMKA